MKLTEAAIKQIKEILGEEPGPTLGKGMYLRLAIAGGGCSGFQYAFSLDQQEVDDTVFEDVVVVDSMSLQYLEQATIDYKTSLEGSMFVIDNPGVKNTCGCGSSFTMD